MRAISLHQPWATAVALGHKKIETRSWSTEYRGPLAIHAALKFDRPQREFAQIERTLGRMPPRIPRGAIVCVVDLKDVRRTEDLVLTISAIEKMYGNYSAGRYGWLFENVRVLPNPLPWKGRQRWFDVPDATIEAALAESA